MDAGFYRGTSTEQDIRFTDKERKLLKQMKFEQVLEQKVDLQKVNLDVIKPWITLKLNEILGMEDDVVVEYVFTQLEERELNPKKMQINLTGFLNARRAREFMGELWHMFMEAQNSPEGIPSSLVERKVQELKIANASRQPDQSFAKATEIDWQYRYKSLTGGRYGKVEPSYAVKVEHEQPDSTTADQRERGDRDRERDRERDSSRDRERERDRERRRREREEEREERAKRRLRYEEERFMERKDLLREKQRQEEREERRRGHRRSPSSDESPAPPIRRFTESGGAGRSNNHDDERDRKKGGKKSHKRHHSDSGEEEDRKKSKKHKKDKKSKKHKERD